MTSSGSAGAARSGGTRAAGREVTTTLSDSQLEQVASDIAGDPGLSAWLGDDPEPLREIESLLANGRLSHSLLRALLVLVAFPADERGRELTYVASELGISASTVHRYAATWMAVGLLARDPASRRYRRLHPGTAEQSQAVMSDER